MLARGRGGQKSENIADIICECSLSRRHVAKSFIQVKNLEFRNYVTQRVNVCIDVE